MFISTPEELARPQRIGSIAVRVLKETRMQLRPGITTGELDAIAGKIFAETGARSAPAMFYYFFPYVRKLPAAGNLT